MSKFKSNFVKKDINWKEKKIEFILFIFLLKIHNM